MSATINHPALRIWHVVKPVLVEHIGTVFTYAPDRPVVAASDRLAA